MIHQAIWEVDSLSGILLILILYLFTKMVGLLQQIIIIVIFIIGNPTTNHLSLTAFFKHLMFGPGNHFF